MRPKRAAAQECLKTLHDEHKQFKDKRALEAKQRRAEMEANGEAAYVPVP